ncbi:hypothetical protein ACFVH4_19170 [Nocardia ignorata]
MSEFAIPGPDGNASETNIEAPPKQRIDGFKHWTKPTQLEQLNS